MKAMRWCVAGVFFGLLIAGSGNPAGAEMDENTNSCVGTGTFVDGGFTVDSRTVGTEVVTVPRSDTVNWEGSVAAAPGAYEGKITVRLPKPFGEVTIDTWEGDSQTTSNSGVEEYDLPSWVPGGVTFKVLGEHRDANGVCKGYVNVEIDGNALGSPITWVSLAGTAATGAGLAMGLRPMFRRVAS